MKKKTILRIISVGMLVIAAVFVIFALNCPQNGLHRKFPVRRGTVDHLLQALCPGDGVAVRRVVLGKGAVRKHG